jgi:type IV pilus assembly protein PilE
MTNLVQHSRHVSRPPVRHAGFTLIELMIAVAIVAIVAMIAIPSYKAQLVKGRRSSAEAALLDIAQREQQYLLDARGYAYSVTALYSVAALNAAIPVNVLNYYTISFAPPPLVGPPTFTALATPIAGTAQAGDVTLTIDQTGAKAPANIW